jgi:hypothetical protein
LLVATSLFSPGCGDALSSACETELRHRARCDSTYTGAQFSNDLRACTTQPRNVREDYYRGVQRCYEQFGCPHSSAEITRCVGEASATLTTSEAARNAAQALCAACPARIAPNRQPSECVSAVTTPSASWGAPTGPIDLWILNDPTIDRLVSCFRAGAPDCNTVHSCLLSTLR